MDSMHIFQCVVYPYQLGDIKVFQISMQKTIKWIAQYIANIGWKSLEQLYIICEQVSGMLFICKQFIRIYCRLISHGMPARKKEIFIRNSFSWFWLWILKVDSGATCQPSCPPAKCSHTHDMGPIEFFMLCEQQCHLVLKVIITLQWF